MLHISVPKLTSFDEETNTFLEAKGAELMLEHSLVSLSKWESKHEKPFMGKTEKTTAETLSYIECMNLAPVDDPQIFSRLSDDNIKTINEYISSSQTGTFFREIGGAKKADVVITAEIIYYWMTAHSIPFETQYWHLNRLLTLIKVCNEKSKPAGKQSRITKQDSLAQRRALNAKRKAELGTSG